MKPLRLATRGSDLAVTQSGWAASEIEAASRKGDLMPLREMERRLKGLDA